jgi:hypothetical protein
VTPTAYTQGPGPAQFLELTLPGGDAPGGRRPAHRRGRAVRARHRALEQSRRYAAAATAVGGRVEVVAPAGDHRVVFDPAGEAWRRAVDWLAARRTAVPDRTTLGP